jgi:hypothetical protein
MVYHCAPHHLSIDGSLELGDDPASRHHPDAITQTEDLIKGPH